MTGDPTATGPAAGAFPSAAPTTPADAERRRLLTYAAGAVGGAGLIATAYPFVDSFEPSAKALAAGGPVEAAWGELQLGQMRTVAWRGKPVWLMRRTPAMVAELDKGIPQLLDPDSKHSQQPAACRNATRSLIPDLFVAVGICTHLGCSPVLKVGDPAFEAEMSGDDGYYCPCHGSRYDLAGRVVRNVPAPLNLVIPPYTLLPGKRVRIG